MLKHEGGSKVLIYKVYLPLGFRITTLNTWIRKKKLLSTILKKKNPAQIVGRIFRWDRNINILIKSHLRRNL